MLLAGLLASGGNSPLLRQHRVTSSRDARRFRMTLVVGEIALAGLLCAGTLFLLRSYREIDARDHGFDPAATLTFRLAVPEQEGRTRGEVARLYESIRLSIASIPGVAAVGASTNLPWSGYDENTSFTIAGRAPAAGAQDDGPGHGTRRPRPATSRRLGRGS